ncbi:MAG: hypothetical protein ACM3NR_03510 [Methanosarcina sp.]
MKKLRLLSSFFLIFFVYSCSEEITDLNTGSDLNTNTMNEAILQVCGSHEYTLWAGQHINAGTLTVSNDETNLYVTYTLTSGTFGTLHLWVGTDITLLPMNSQGTPIPGQFPYVKDANGLSTYTFTIKLTDIPFYSKCGDHIYVVAHAEWGNETIFGGDKEGNSGTNRWYYYAEYVTACCETPPPPPPSERLGTAFAKAGWVFVTDKKSNPENLPSLLLLKNRWGWAANINETGTTFYQLWVGAGLNNTSKGIMVGNVTVNYDGSQVTVTYTVNSTYSIEELHIYANDNKPVTAAPGQYGNTFYFDPRVKTFSTTINVSDTDSDGIWLIMHAIIWGPGVTNP